MGKDVEVRWIGPFQVVVSIGDAASCMGTIYHNGRAMVLAVDSVEVDEKHRRQGLATALMWKVLELARSHGVDSVELVVNADNGEAKGLYEKVGFEKTTKEHWRMLLNSWENNNKKLVVHKVDPW